MYQLHLYLQLLGQKDTKIMTKSIWQFKETVPVEEPC